MAFVLRHIFVLFEVEGNHADHYENLRLQGNKTKQNKKRAWKHNKLEVNLTDLLMIMIVNRSVMQNLKRL